MRAGLEEGDPAPQERPVLQDPQWGSCRRPVHESDLHVPVEPGKPVRLPDRVAAARRRSGGAPRAVDAVELPRRAGLSVDDSVRAIRIDPSTRATTHGTETMPGHQPKPRRPVPSIKPPEPAAELRRAPAGRKKAELVDVLMEMAEADRAVLRRLTIRFYFAATTDELVAATHQAIADATAFDKRDINRNFDYDYEAYAEVKRNLGRLIAAGQLRLALQLALELMKQGCYQVEMSDEGPMTEDIEDCLSVVIEALRKCDLPAAEVVGWCSAMLEND